MAMSVSSVSSSAPFQTNGVRPSRKRRQEFEALGKALKSGDLAGAKKAFAALTGGSGSSTSAAGATQDNSPFAQLAQALQSGNLQAAQQAFAGMVQNHHGHHGPHGHRGGGDGQGSSVAAIGSSSSTTEDAGNYFNTLA